MDAGRLAAAARALQDATRVLVVTGAGISAESGIPTFRGAGGLWEGFRAEELATPGAFRADPERVWRWYRWRRAQYHDCAPNPGHHALVAIERACAARSGAFLLATQNVDGLHRRVGHTALVELHGCIEQMRCVACSAIAPLPEAPPAPDDDPVPRCAACGDRMRPHILWFGESYWPGIIERVAGFAERAELVLVVGTSGAVWPPVQLALHAQQHGAFMIDVNPADSELSRAAEVHLRAPSGVALPSLLSAAGVAMEHPA